MVKLSQTVNKPKRKALWGKSSFRADSPTKMEASIVSSPLSPTAAPTLSLPTHIPTIYSDPLETNSQPSVQFSLEKRGKKEGAGVTFPVKGKQRARFNRGKTSGPKATARNHPWSRERERPVLYKKKAKRHNYFSHTQLFFHAYVTPQPFVVEERASTVSDNTYGRLRAHEKPLKKGRRWA